MIWVQEREFVERNRIRIRKNFDLIQTKYFVAVSFLKESVEEEEKREMQIWKGKKEKTYIWIA